MRAISAMFCLSAILALLLAGPAKAAAQDLRPIVVIHSVRPQIMMGRTVDYVLFSNGEAFVYGPELRRLRFDPQALAKVMDGLRGIPGDAGGRPNVADAATVYMTVWDETAKIYRRHHASGLVCLDDTPERCAEQEAEFVNRRFHYWVRQLPSMVQENGEPWWPASVLVVVEKTSLKGASSPFPTGTTFEDASEGYRIACVPFATDAEFRSAASKWLHDNGASNAEIDRPGKWKVAWWYVPTPYGLLWPGSAMSDPRISGCAPLQ